MTNYFDDTIAAIATAVSNSGISIIRISGNKSIETADSIFRAVSGKRLSEKKSHTISFGHIYDGENVIDEVLVSVMKAPNTYTREDVVEINCHGGIRVTNRILGLILSKGIRPAEPGEFTKRAFLNGRIDLSQAEAVMDIINAENDYALASSVAQLNGNLFKKIRTIRERVLYDVAFIESALDDPEHIDVDERVDEMRERVDISLKEVDKLLKNADNGRLIKEGIKTVIVGKPNVGKSSLLNLLAKDEIAIVTDVPGTTRDSIEMTVTLGDVELNIIDTAGIRESDDIVEKIGIDRAIDKLEQANLILFLMDASRQIDENDEKIMKLIADRDDRQKAMILVNKSELEHAFEYEIIKEKTGLDPFSISVKNESGITEFEDYIKKLFFNGELDFNNEIYITNARQKNALLQAKKSLENVIESFDMGMSEDFITIDMMDAYESLGCITGDSTREDLADKIFKEFCMGK